MDLRFPIAGVAAHPDVFGVVAVVSAVGGVGAAVDLRFCASAIHVVQPDLILAVIDDAELQQLAAFLAELLADHNGGVVVDRL